MPPDRAALADPPMAATRHSEWRAALVRLSLAALALVALASREWGEMLDIWWNIDSYSHILLIPAIIAWLVWIRREDAAQVVPRGWWPGLAALAAALALWLVGRYTDLNLLAHAGAVAMLPAAALALLGPRVGALLALPLGFAVFLVPFGDEIVPPLQYLTAEMAIALTHMVGVPARIEGIYIHTPAGLFIVAEACAGVHFLIAMIALGVLTCFTSFTSWRRRAAFMVACVVVPILANGIRAWATIYIAQFVGAEAAGGFDHIVYGWIFFGLVVALILGVAWRWFEREPEDAGWTLEELRRSALLAVLERHSAPTRALLLVILALAALAATLAFGLPAG
ncbi:exosortase A [Erythrobacter sp. QSSC1-22B]|uniref:exosortase A n=1 Tax=Erythrobacter sp. QSSC1-22B TaxID=1860125 RepID=UPI000805E4D0|nr:exosortase A [Erythrobacter sp. QSSC1-22B]OBX20352.1 exosortase A [Erythrobacter sp. QSSC1-22B]